MKFDFRTVACMAVVLLAGLQEATQSQTTKSGVEKFESTVESLRANYRAPEWFRDAKFGIYVHWGVYSVPEMGEWYARNMYVESRPEYRYHVEKYGHPSSFGYRDFIPLWKAEKFDPDALLAMFEQAGARYFCPCAVHHDNFDLWNSKHNPWNAVNMGPKRDLVGMWKEATLKQGLRFGVTTHLERTWSWVQTNKGADTTGPFKGVPYDGANPEFADFYLPRDPKGDDNRRHPLNAPAEWRENWARRIKDLIDNYQPDHLYFDGGIPFLGDDQGQSGLEVIAYYYNQNASWHGGHNEGVMCVKHHKANDHGFYWEGVATQDFERGRADRLCEAPWQTDDSIGPWGYRRGAKYKSVDQIVDKMVDIISKNGNYLLNVPPRADGTLDEKTIAILTGIGRWLDVNGEAIYGSRPWTSYGDGDTRFTTQGETLYTIHLTPEPGETF